LTLAGSEENLLKAQHPGTAEPFRIAPAKPVAYTSLVMGVMEQGTDLRFLWRVSKWPHRNFFWGPKFNFGSDQWWYFPKRTDFHQGAQKK
jgi:hypothetical protein